jgi:outer membrane protein, heavy metal efflux system
VIPLTRSAVINRRKFLALMLIIGLSACAQYQPRALPQTPVATPLTSPPATKPDLPLSIADVAQWALAHNADLAAARAAAKIADAQLFAAGLWPDPQFSVGIDQPSTPGEVLGWSEALALDLPLDLPLRFFGQRLNLLQARQLAAQAHLELRWQTWSISNQARTMALQLMAAQTQLQLAQSAALQAQRALQASDQLLASGDQKLDENALYRATFLDADSRRRALERDLSAARFGLNALLALEPTDTLTLQDWAPSVAALLPKALPDTKALWQLAQSQRADLQGLRAAFEASDTGLKSALRAQYGGVQLSLGGGRDTGAVHTLSGGLSFTLPLWNRGRGGIAVASATREQLAQSYQARLSAAYSDIVSLRARYLSTLADADALGPAVAQLAQSAERLQAAAARHDVDVLRVQPLRTALLDQQLKLLQLQADALMLRVALENALGQLLPETTL